MTDGAAGPAEAMRRFLVEAAAALAGSLDYETTLASVARLAVGVFADWCGVELVADDGSTREVAVAHVDPRRVETAHELRRRYPPDPNAPRGVPSVIRTGRSEIYPEISDEMLVATYPGEEQLRFVRELGFRSAMIVPLVARGRTLGALSFGSTAPGRHYGGEDLAVAEDLAARAALAVDNARLYRDAEEAVTRLRFLAEAGAALAATLDPAETLERLVRLAVLSVTDWCIVFIVEPDGSIRQRAVAHADPAKVEMAWEIERRHPLTVDAPHGAPAVVRSGRSELIAEIPDAVLEASARDAEHLRALRALGFRSALTVPMAARGGVLGALSFATAESGRRFGPQDVLLAEQLAGHAALAFENASLYKQAQDAIKARDVFLSVASHELLTPVTSIQLQLQSIRRALARRAEAAPPDPIAAKVASAERQLRRLTVLTNELLDVSRIGAGRLALHLEDDVDLAALAREVAVRFSAQLEEAGCALALRAAAPVRGRWDASRLDQVLTNLLSNAVKYGRGGPIEIEVALADERTARLVVRDAGIGIDPKDHARIFGRFERAASERHYGGLGMGLWIAQHIVKAHGGALRVESAPGSGSTFSADLPRDPALAAAEPPA